MNQLAFANVVLGAVAAVEAEALANVVLGAVAAVADN